MTNIVVVVFDDMRQASELRSALMRLDAQKEIRVDDVCFGAGCHSGFGHSRA